MLYASNSIEDPNGVMHCNSVSDGNRSRLDSGTSGSSEGSRGSGKPPRRRSHRPRGCRGGSNRRRNNSTDYPKRSSTKRNDTKSKSGKNDVLSKHPKNKSTVSQAPGLQKFTLLSRQNRRNPAFNSDYRQGMLQRESSSSSAMSVSTAPMTDISSLNGSYENQPTDNDFSWIQPSLSDSSSEFGADPYFQGNFILPPDNDNLGSNSRSSSDHQILPPLPSADSQKKPVPMGPNPYALNLTNHGNVHESHISHSRENFPHLREPACMDATKFPGGYATPMKNLMQPRAQHSYPLQPFSNIDNRNYHASMGPPPPRPGHILRMPTSKPSMCVNGPIGCSRENDYRAGRLEIQRQTVEGGSLFVTSPRSFLMGKRNGTGTTGHAF